MKPIILKTKSFIATLALMLELCVTQGSAQVNADLAPLSIKPVPGGVRISWTNSYTTYVLEEAPTLNDSWGRVQADYELDDSRVSVFVPALQNSRFFRLQRAGWDNPGVTPAPAPYPPSVEALIAYLNDNYLPKVWPHVQDFVKNQVIHQTYKQIDAAGFHMHLDDTSFNMNSLPRFQLNSDGIGLHARFPATGSYVLKTFVEEHIDCWPIDVCPDPGAGIRAAFALDLDLSAGAKPVATPYASVDLTGILGSLIDPFFDEESYAGRITGPLANQLGFLEPMRFDPSAPFTVANPEFVLLFGDSALRNSAALDVVLVADGFDQSQLSQFDAQADAIMHKLTDADPNHVNEPFASFRHALRIWKLNAISPAGSARERIITSYNDALTGTRKTTLANLARFARAGYRSRMLGGDLMVVVSAVRTASGSLDTSVRASAFGDLVLLPIDSSPAATATVLTHELGHTLLGGLADEYVEGSLTGETYRGLEPVNPNVQLLKSSAAQSKWARWAANFQAAPWDQQIGNFSFEGGYLFGKGIYRPAAHCKMKESGSEVPFCQVCREALTRGIHQHLSYGPKATLKVSYSSPWASSEQVAVFGSGSGVTKTLRACGDSDTLVRLRLASTPLPKPWRPTWSLRRGSTTLYTLTGEDVSLAVRRYDKVVVNINTQCPFLGAGRFPSYYFILDFSEPADCPTPPTAPTNPTTRLTSEPRVEQVCIPEIRRCFYITNYVDVLRATSSDANGDKVKFDFEVKPVGTAFNGLNLLSTGLIAPSASLTVSGSVEPAPSSSPRYYRVRAVDETGLSSAWVTGPEF